ncbi:MAG: serine/threonine protein kinase [Gammaproteobacteria bacterium]|nr:serine/threonine protein kinase [Gammaproteobacteria bacterium]
MSQTPYAGLAPELILDAVESQGWRVDGRLAALNSYENRVYQIGIEDGPPLIAKFYRPGRWSDAAILEEHQFAAELVEREIPVVAPLQDAQGVSLWTFQGFRFALFPRRSGRAPELDNEDTLQWLGRFLARIHAVGAIHPFQHRPVLDIVEFGEQSAEFLLKDFLPHEQRNAYRAASAAVLKKIAAAYASAGDVTLIRLHGDCHPGNILWTPEGPHFVDLDDARMGPAVQDLWMLLSGTRTQKLRQVGVILDAYQDFYEFDPRELVLNEALRALRIMHYAAWLARRWDDPAFPQNFPWFNTRAYWEEHISSLQEQAMMMDEPPLVY